MVSVTTGAGVVGLGSQVGCVGGVDSPKGGGCVGAPQGLSKGEGLAGAAVRGSGVVMVGVEGNCGEELVMGACPERGGISGANVLGQLEFGLVEIGWGGAMSGGGGEGCIGAAVAQVSNGAEGGGEGLGCDQEGVVPKGGVGADIGGVGREASKAGVWGDGEGGGSGGAPKEGAAVGFGLLIELGSFELSIGQYV